MAIQAPQAILPPPIPFTTTGHRISDPWWRYLFGANGTLKQVASAVPEATPAVTHQFFTAYDVVGGTFTQAQPTASDLTNGTTGSGEVVLQNSPSLVTPTLGHATATSINKITITPPATGATITIDDGKTFVAANSITVSGVDGKTLTVDNSLALAGTDGTTMTFPGTSDTVVGEAAAQTLTNKTLNGATIAASSTVTGALVTSSAINASNFTNSGCGAQTAPGAPIANFFFIYMDTADNKLKPLGPSGTITVLANP